MNDAYVGLFIIAAVTLFAALWTGRLAVAGRLLGRHADRRRPARAGARLQVGRRLRDRGRRVLVLIRSALGRMLLILGLILATTVLGYMAISTPSGDTAGANLMFLVLMIGLTLAAVVGCDPPADRLDRRGGPVRGRRPGGPRDRPVPRWRSPFGPGDELDRVRPGGRPGHLDRLRRGPGRGSRLCRLRHRRQRRVRAVRADPRARRPGGPPRCRPRHRRPPGCASGRWPASRPSGWW